MTLKVLPLLMMSATLTACATKPPSYRTVTGRGDRGYPAPELAETSRNWRTSSQNCFLCRGNSSLPVTRMRRHRKRRAIPCQADLRGE